MPILHIKKTLLATLAFAVIIGSTLTYAPRAAKGDIEQQVQSIPNAVQTTQADVVALATNVANEYGIKNVSQFVGTMSCEIKKADKGYWDYTAQSDFYWKGIREDSWGGWQINLPSHPDVTKAEAQDIVWATNWAAKQWLSGQAHQWTCYRNLYQ